MSKGKDKKQKSGLGAGIIAFGAIFALYSVLFHPHTLGSYLLAGALSFFAGSVIRVMAQGLDLTTHNKEPESLKKVLVDTGNPEVDELLTRGREMILEIREENAKIPDESLSAKLDELENQCAEIFRAVYDKPAKAAQIRKFMDYYLPTTLKMVKSYRLLGERDYGSAESFKARQRIDEALGVVIKGCHNMLDNLYRDDMLDIATDIDVLEQMLKRDGLTENDLRKAAQQARQAAMLDNEINRAQRQIQQAAQAVQTQPAAQPQYHAAPAITPSSGVNQAVESAKQQAQQHFPQVPTLDGQLYPTYGGQAMAQAPQNQKQQQ